MTQMENEAMTTDSLEERIEQLGKRMRKMELRGIGFDAEQRLRSDIRILRSDLGILVSDVEDKIDAYIQQPPTGDIDNPLYLEDYIGVINSDLGEASKLLAFLYENWHRVRVKK